MDWTHSLEKDTRVMGWPHGHCKRLPHQPLPLFPCRCPAWWGKARLPSHHSSATRLQSAYSAAWKHLKDTKRACVYYPIYCVLLHEDEVWANDWAQLDQKTEWDGYPLPLPSPSRSSFSLVQSGEPGTVGCDAWYDLPWYTTPDSTKPFAFL